MALALRCCDLKDAIFALLPLRLPRRPSSTAMASSLASIPPTLTGARREPRSAVDIGHSVTSKKCVEAYNL